MSSLKEHCEDCIKEMGKDYKEVHMWLDEFFVKLGSKHRSIRHHKEGVQEVIEKFGVEAGRAAEIHIRKDWWGMLPSKKQAEMWSIFGVEGIDYQSEYLSDEQIWLAGDVKGQK